MLEVKTPAEVLEIMRDAFSHEPLTEQLSLSDAFSRVCAEDIISDEYVPSFDRSTVDGYALKASDSFGCSDAIPAVLRLQGKIEMGQAEKAPLLPGCCFEVSTGGFVPEGADAVVMKEYSENYGDGSIGIASPAAPGLNCVFRGDELKPKAVIIPKGRKLGAADIGALAALGKTRITLVKKLLVGIISTGDELVDASEKPKNAQVRNVNSPLLAAALLEAGADYIDYGILKDDEALISECLDRAVSECDMVLISGGSSAGAKDKTEELIQKKGELLFHGIAMKPGKPTMLGKIKGRPVFGIAGHPGAVFFIANIFIKPLIRQLTGENCSCRRRTAILGEAVSSNHGRAEYIAVRLKENGAVPEAEPIISKSGQITRLAGTDAYIVIPEDCEGLSKGETVEVYYVV